MTGGRSDRQAERQRAEGQRDSRAPAPSRGRAAGGEGRRPARRRSRRPRPRLRLHPGAFLARNCPDFRQDLDQRRRLSPLSCARWAKDSQGPDPNKAGPASRGTAGHSEGPLGPSLGTVTGPERSIRTGRSPRGGPPGPAAVTRGSLRRALPQGPAGTSRSPRQDVERRRTDGETNQSQTSAGVRLS